MIIILKGFTVLVTLVVASLIWTFLDEEAPQVTEFLRWVFAIVVLILCITFLCFGLGLIVEEVTR